MPLLHSRSIGLPSRSLCTIATLEGKIKVKYIEDITRWLEDMNFMFSWQEHKIYIFEPTCNVLIYMEKPIQQKQKAGIVTSLNDTTLTKVTYGKYATRVPDEVAYGIYEWFSSH